MYPTLYHALLDLTGIDLPFLAFLNSFGFFVAIAFYFASWTLSMELRRKESAGLLRPSLRTVVVGAPASPLELALQGLLGFVLGWKVLYLLTNSSEVLADTKAFLLSTQGSVVGGLAVGGLFVWLRWREKKKAQLAEPKNEQVQVLPSEHATQITLTAALWGFIGAKLFHWLENPGQFVAFLRSPSGDDIMTGLTMYGGLILAGFMVIRYFRKHGIPAWHGADAAAPGVMLAYAVGRIGCQVSGDGDWGIVNKAPAPSWLPQWLWSYDYPNNVNAIGVPLLDGRPCFPGYCTVLPEPVFPTPVYETLVCLLFFGVLWVLRKKVAAPGTIFFVFLFLNGLERFFIEKIRVNVELFGNWTQAEVISLLLMLVGIGGAWWTLKCSPLEHGPEETN